MADLPDSATPRLREALAYWEKKRGKRHMPARGEIRLGEVPAFVANLVLLAVEPAPLDLRFEFVGTAVRLKLGEIAGKRMSELPAMAPGTRVFETWASAVRGGRPHYVEAPYVARGGRVVSAQDMLMPLGGEDGTVDGLMAVLEFHVPVPGLRARHAA